MGQSDCIIHNAAGLDFPQFPLLSAKESRSTSFRVKSRTLFRVSPLRAQRRQGRRTRASSRSASQEQADSNGHAEVGRRNASPPQSTHCGARPNPRTFAQSAATPMERRASIHWRAHASLRVLTRDSHLSRIRSKAFPSSSMVASTSDSLSKPKRPTRKVLKSTPSPKRSGIPAAT